MLFELKIISIEEIKKLLGIPYIYLFVNNKNLYKVKSYIVLRNKNTNRNNDIINIKNIINILNGKLKSKNIKSKNIKSKNIKLIIQTRKKIIKIYKKIRPTKLIKK